MAETHPPRDSFGLVDFFVRLAGALLMVLATWNPGGHSFVDWVGNAWSADTLGAVHAFVGVLLLIGWVILLRATFNSLGLFGLVLGGLLLGVTVWLLFDLGVLRGGSTTTFAWIVLCCIAILLALGLSWSYVWKRLTGQVDVDDFDRH
jgi:hypothetical protein